MNIGCTCIIPFYNEEERILSVLQTLDEIKQLTHIIVVDDGSTDHGAKIVQQYCLQHTHISLISYPNNAGKSHAVYIGLQEVTTPYVLLFDADLFDIKKEEVVFMIENMQCNSEIDMGILRRISSDWYIKLFYRELILSGQRMLRTQDLKDAFAATSINRYQLEVAINMYMKRHKKLTLRYPFSAENTFKHHKRGFRYGRKRDFGMYRDIFSYGGFPSFCKHIFLFKPKKFTKYNQHSIHK